MYFPVGWPKILALPGHQRLLKVSFDREKCMFAVVTNDSVGIWFNNVCQQIKLCIWNEN